MKPRLEGPGSQDRLAHVRAGFRRVHRQVERRQASRALFAHIRLFLGWTLGLTLLVLAAFWAAGIAS